MTTATSRYFALLALTAALWGAQPLLVKITMRELNPSTMTAVRYLLMSITFFALMRWRGLPLLPPLRLSEKNVAKALMQPYLLLRLQGFCTRHLGCRASEQTLCCSSFDQPPSPRPVPKVMRQ